MISKMLKYSFLIFHKEYDEFLLNLRNLGVVHIEEKESGTIDSPELQQLMQKMGELKSLDDYLSLYVDAKYEKGSGYTPSVERGQAIVGEVEDLRLKLEKINQRIPQIQKEIELMTPWGDFDFASVDRLRDKGYQLNFYTCAVREFQQEWEEKYNAITVHEDGTTKYFVTVTHVGEEVDINVEKAKMSSSTLAQLNKMLEEIYQEKQQTEDAVRKLANVEKESFDLYSKEVASEMEFSKVHLSGVSYAGDKLIMLVGWIPEDKKAELDKFLDSTGVFYETEVPKLDEANVPIQLKNGSFSKLFEPITRMFSLPSYSELDLTPFLAPFFMLFFGLCMGDGGYGLLIVLACLYLKRKVSDDMKGYCNLGLWLGGMTIVVGILTGAFFGIALDSVTWEWLAGVKKYFLTEANYKDKLGYNPMMIFAIVIGVVQILFGMCLAAAKATKQNGFKYSLSTIAWVVAIISGIAYLGIPALGVEFSAAVNYVFYVIFGLCAILIYFYNSPGKNPIVNVGAGLWNTYNMATGLLGDTLSYIRLFALGLTGSILGGVFNELAFSLTEGLPFVVQFIGALIILLFGHSINFGLCMIGSFVHPLRLTFVEFYKNASFDGGGQEYKPFKK